MSLRCLVIAAALLLPLQGCGRRGVAGEESFRRHAMDLLRSKAVASLEVLYYSRHTVFAASVSPEMLGVSVTPDMLEEIYQHKLSVNKFHGSRWQRDLIRALQDPAMRRASGLFAHFQPDCRWGCIFYDAKRDRVLTMYFDGYGSEGLIGGTPVVFTGRFGKLKLVRLLQNRCLPRWE